MIRWFLSLFRTWLTFDRKPTGQQRYTHMYLKESNSLGRRKPNRDRS